MIRKIFFSSIPILFLFNLLLVSAQDNTNIELLDIEKNKITTIPTNSKVQLETKKIIEEVDGIVKKFNPIPNKGYLVKIPLTQSLRLENKWVNTLIDEVFIIIPQEEKPYLLIFDNEHKPYFFTIKTEIDPLLKTLTFPF
ncbi:hypothetical protein [Bacillus sp. FJAT-22090]|uniref:hypothetical protein n=1 Tax=Bacillus sp. FJAT-22090 TaxID=1581038 RepID=UPI0011A86E15|nr:hypothetical protein [Bacillus sp. FJAT-22090]